LQNILSKWFSRKILWIKGLQVLVKENAPAFAGAFFIFCSFTILPNCRGCFLQSINRLFSVALGVVGLDRNWDGSA
jgi:hypothetical protein